MNLNLCPLCRRSMRFWALDARLASLHQFKQMAVRVAQSFRDECLHTDAEKYDALVGKLKTLAPDTWLHRAVWREIERIKNCHAGHRPVGRTFNAWQHECGISRHSQIQVEAA